MDESKIKSIGKPTRSVMNFLSRVPIFNELSFDELETVVPFMSYMQLDQGEILFKEGEHGNYVFFVAKGILDIYKKSASGGDVVIASLTKGHSVGEMSIIDTFPRSATVRTRTEAMLLIITKAGFNRILTSHPAIGIKILKGISRLLSQSLRKTSTRLVDYMLPLS